MNREMLTSLFSASAAPAVGVVSLTLGVLGFSLTAWGLRLTFLQAKHARSQAASAQRSSQAAVEAVTAFRFRIDRYSAYRDISEAEFAMETCKRHLEIPAWKHASDSYEMARKAIIRVSQASIELDAALSDQLKGVSDHMGAFCDKVDAALAGKGSYPNVAKVTSAVRQNYAVLSAVKLAIQKDVL